MIFNSLGDMKGSEFQDYQQQQLTLHHHKRESLSDEVDSRSSGEAKRQKQTQEQEQEQEQAQKIDKGGSGCGDGASIEVVRRPRGRPPGSKNKPKPPVIITRETEPSWAMRPHVLEIPGGHDVAEALSHYSRRRNLGICVLAGTGSVANVTLRQPPLPGGLHPVPEGATIGFRGRFEILSISATFFPQSLAALSAAANLSISLAGPQGQVVGGTVAGPLMAVGTVVVVAAAFNNPTFHRLPADDDVSVSVSGAGGEVEASGHAEHDQDLHQQQHHAHHHKAPPAVAEAEAHVALARESCAMSIYSCSLPSDVIWAPAARPPPPPPY